MGNNRTEPGPLTKTAIEAYLHSELRQRDIEHRQEAAGALSEFLSWFGIDVELQDNFIEIEEIVFFAEVDSAGSTQLHWVYAHRICPVCGDILAWKGVSLWPESDDAERRDAVESLGRWIHEKHLCQPKLIHQISLLPKGSESATVNI